MGVLTKQPEALTNDVFFNLLDMNTEWQKSAVCDHLFEGRDRRMGEVRWLGSRVDLVFGSNSQRRALAEVNASEDAEQKFVHDFVSAWTRVMNLDRFDLEPAVRSGAKAGASSALSRFEFRVVDLAKGPAARGSLARSTTTNPNSLSCRSTS